MATALAVAGIAATVISAGVTAYGQEQAGQAAQNQSNYQAAIARNNVIAAQQAADQVRQQGDQQSAQAALKGRQLISAQRATFAGNGVDANSGSAVNIQGDTAANTKLDELTVTNNAERQAIGFENQGANFNAQAGADMIAGNNAVGGQYRVPSESVAHWRRPSRQQVVQLHPEIPRLRSAPASRRRLWQQRLSEGVLGMKVLPRDRIDRARNDISFGLSCEGHRSFSGGRESRLVNRLLRPRSMRKPRIIAAIHACAENAKAALQKIEDRKPGTGYVPRRDTGEGEAA